MIWLSNKWSFSLVWSCTGFFSLCQFTRQQHIKHFFFSFLITEVHSTRLVSKSCQRKNVSKIKDFGPFCFTVKPMMKVKDGQVKSTVKGISLLRSTHPLLALQKWMYACTHSCLSASRAFATADSLSLQATLEVSKGKIYDYVHILEDNFVNIKLEILLQAENTYLTWGEITLSFNS